jgi:hypothetical protein
VNKSAARKFSSFRRFRRNFAKYGLRKVKHFEVVVFWLKSILSRSQFLILSGILVGFTCGLAGVVLKTLVHYIHYLITHKVNFEDQIFFYLLFPFLGIVITSLMVIVFFNGQDKKGVPAILYEIARNSSVVSSVKMYSQVVQSAITVGLGGSAGLESPIAVTGAAIGSNFAQTYKLNYKERTLLLAAGATAGIASAFNCPGRRGHVCYRNSIDGGDIYRLYPTCCCRSMWKSGFQNTSSGGSALSIQQQKLLRSPQSDLLCNLRHFMWPVCPLLCFDNQICRRLFP